MANMEKRLGAPPFYHPSNYWQPMYGSYPPPAAYQAPPQRFYQQPPPGQADPQRGPPPLGGYLQGGVVVSNQPGPMVYSGQHQTVVATSAPLTNPPPDYLIFSILAMWCCWPIAIAAIIFSCLSRSAANRGDDVTAFVKGQTAKKLCIAAVVIGVILTILCIVVQVIAAASYSSE